MGVKGGFGKLRVCIDEGELDVMLRYSTGNTFSNNLNPYALHTGMKYDCFLQLGSAFETGHQYSGPRVCHGEDATRCKVVTLAAAMNRKEFGVEIQELDIAFDKAHVNPGSNQKLSCAGNRTAQTFKVDKIEAVDAQSQKSKAAGMFEVTMDQIMYQRSHVSFTLNYEIDRVVDATGQMFKLTKDSER